VARRQNGSMVRTGPSFSLADQTSVFPRYGSRLSGCRADEPPFCLNEWGFFSRSSSGVSGFKAMLLPIEVECNDSTVACFPSGLAPLVHGIFGYLQIIAMDSVQNSEVCPDGLKAGSLRQRHETARLCPERRLLRPSSVDPCDQLGTPHQLPRVMGISTSRCNSMCFENSSLASDARCTSSGPSARRSVRWCA